MANTTTGIYGRKLGMTQIYNDEGNVVPVTIVSVPDNVVLAVKTTDSKDGYAALQIGFGDQKEHRINRPAMGNFKKAGTGPKKMVRELRVTDEVAKKYAAGQTISIGDFLQEGATVDVTGISKGNGFGGVMKKHNFKGFIRSHGTHEYFRHGGSIGTRLTPGMVLKGKKMPGQEGNAQVTVHNQILVKIDADRSLLYVRGGIPGPNGAAVLIRNAVKV